MLQGTWAFKSGHSLEYPRKPPELADDLESFIYVITFFGFRYHHHKTSLIAKNTDSVAFQKQAASDNNGFMGYITGFFYEQRRAGRGYYEGGSIKRIFIESGVPPLVLQPLDNGRRPLIARFLAGGYKLLKEHYAATRPGRYEEFAVRPSDQAAPDEGDHPPPDRPDASDPRSRIVSTAAGRAVQMKRLGAWRNFITTERVEFEDDEESLAAVSNSPFEDPKRVLDDHVALGKLFASMVVDKNGEQLDLTGLLGDKRFDQFRCWDEYGYTRKKGKSGHRRGASPGNSSAQQTTASKRSREDLPEDEPVPKRATPPRRSAKGMEKRSGRKARFDVLAKSPTAVGAKGKLQAQKVTASRKRTAPRKDTKAQNTKPVRKAAASRQAQASRLPSNPRRAITLKAEVTAKTAISKRVEVAAVAWGMRRSKRLAGPEVAE